MFGLLLTVALVAVLSAPLAAADKKKEKGEKQGRAAGAALAFLAKLDLSAEQQEKIEKIRAEYGPKLAEANKKVGLTKEQRTARAEAAKQAKADGKKGKEIAAAVAEAVKLTGEQQEALEGVQKLGGQLREAVMNVLTEEQRAKVAPRKGKKKKEAA
jgi:hypothetical protein